MRGFLNVHTEPDDPYRPQQESNTLQAFCVLFKLERAKYQNLVYLFIELIRLFELIQISFARMVASSFSSLALSIGPVGQPSFISWPGILVVRAFSRT